MLELINFIAFSIGFNLLFFMYAATKMENQLNPLGTTLFSIFFSVPLSILIAGVYTVMLVYGFVTGSNEEAMWAYLEEREIIE